nr:proline-rich protein 36-like [Microcebus murinus]
MGNSGQNMGCSISKSYKILITFVTKMANGGRSLMSRLSSICAPVLPSVRPVTCHKSSLLSPPPSLASSTSQPKDPLETSSAFSDPPDSLTSPPDQLPPYLVPSPTPSAPPSSATARAGSLPTSPASHHTRSHAGPSGQTLLWPLREVASPEGVPDIHVPFSLFALSHIEKRLGSFTNDPTAYTKESHYLTIFVILASTLTTDEKQRV